MPMNLEMDNLLQKFFQTDTLEKTDVLLIEQFVAQYPFYAPMQYLLAKKYRQFDPSKYNTQIPKTAVFFNNPHWLNNLLQDNELLATNLNVISADIKPEPVLFETPAEDTIAPAEPGEKIEEMNIAVTAAEEQVEAEPPFALGESPAGEENVQEESSFLPGTDATMAEIRQPNPEAPAEGIAKDIDVRELTGEDDIQTVLVDEVPEEKLAGIAPVLPGEAEKEILLQDNNVNAGEAGAPPPADPEKTLTTFPASPLNLSDPPLPDTGNSGLIPIEPYYTIDYFASQGIKLANDDGKDKLSKNLRSFTEWLKTMKRIHPEKLDQEMDKQSATVIQHIAEHSNDHEEVLTEAMAEVYARQGLVKKAAEVYQKLSLQNPDKRAYFAARISKLKET